MQGKEKGTKKGGAEGYMTKQAQKNSLANPLVYYNVAKEREREDSRQRMGIGALTKKSS